jgi:hypothetical protein
VASMPGETSERDRGQARSRQAAELAGGLHPRHPRSLLRWLVRRSVRRRAPTSENGRQHQRITFTPRSPTTRDFALRHSV